ncbi:MAG: manganese efflux pump MntP family protein [Treponema sp.]|jgi:putative Mn2+ efflux pump MntP|nr:manganese efflux pump MntP family protein [Treponema sp.]
MSLPEIVIVAAGLAMDAFAVSITLGLSSKNLRAKEIIIPGIYFGSFQAIMPAIGYFAGTYLSAVIKDFDHWIAFILLGLIGGKMIKDSLSEEPEKKISEKSFTCAKMLVLALATSIDALAVGIAFAFFDVHIIIAVTITGTITLLISMCGVKIGSMFGTKFKSKAEFSGGVVLVIIGLKIAAEHLLFNGP